jgi:hypothetical protein
VSRNLSGTHLEARGVSKRSFIGTLVLDEATSSDTVNYTVDGSNDTYDIGQVSDIDGMYAATDIQICRHGDSAFFDAAIVGNPEFVNMTPDGRVQLLRVQFVEK